MGYAGRVEWGASQYKPDDKLPDNLNVEYEEMCACNLEDVRFDLENVESVQMECNAIGQDVGLYRVSLTDSEDVIIFENTDKVEYDLSSHFVALPHTPLVEGGDSNMHDFHRPGNIMTMDQGLFEGGERQKYAITYDDALELMPPRFIPPDVPFKGLG